MKKNPLPNPNFSCERSLNNEVALIMKSHLNESLVNCIYRATSRTPGSGSQTTINNYYHYNLYPSVSTPNKTLWSLLPASHQQAVTQRPQSIPAAFTSNNTDDDGSAAFVHTPVGKSQFAKNTQTPSSTTTVAPRAFSDIWTQSTIPTPQQVSSQ